eukprot:SAG31_NODE_2211_length_6179_cov_2.919572_1_plen_128_part_00
MGRSYGSTLRELRVGLGKGPAKKLEERGPLRIGGDEEEETKRRCDARLALLLDAALGRLECGAGRGVHLVILGLGLHDLRRKSAVGRRGQAEPSRAAAGGGWGGGGRGAVAGRRQQPQTGASLKEGK